jgi:hypothetical protein
VNGEITKRSQISRRIHDFGVFAKQKSPERAGASYGEVSAVIAAIVQQSQA